MNSTAAAVAFRGRSGPRVGDSQRVSQAALQAELVRGAMVKNTQSISPMPDPLPPAPLLGLVDLAVVAVVAVIGELVKQFAQLWGSNNSRAEKEAIWNKYAYYRAYGFGSSGWQPTASSYPVALAVSVLSPRRTAWPGKLEFSPVPPIISAGGHLVIYGLVSKSIDIANVTTSDISGNHDEGEASIGAPYVGRVVTYDFSNSNIGNAILATYSGSTNIPTEPQENPYSHDPVHLVPITGLSPLDRMPLFPAGASSVAQKAPSLQPQTPTADAVPVVPTVTASPELTATAQVTRSNFYVPSRLPAPLKPPATATRSTTGAGTLVAPAALPIPQTSTDQRQYGSQIITSIGVRPDVVAIAEEVGRMEQKLGRLLGGMDTTPDWLDGALGPLLNQLRDAILDALVVDVPATVYEFEAPCDKDTNGDPVVLASEIEALDYQPAIVARLDAIAEAMGVLKGWKQPMCRVNPPQSNVTVTAYEYDPEA